MALQEETGYDIIQKQGQRIFGGPPPGWTGPPPGRGTEIYCYRIPRYVSSEPRHLNEAVVRDCFEDELVPLFMSVGKIYELRLSSAAPTGRTAMSDTAPRIMPRR